MIRKELGRIDEMYVTHISLFIRSTTILEYIITSETYPLLLTCECRANVIDTSQI